MSSKTSKSVKSRRPKPRSAVILAAAAVYVVLFAAAFIYLSGVVHTETGELVPGESFESSNISRSLDLRAAAKNVYPSEPLGVVQDLGAVTGASEKIISFKVPADGLTEYGLMTLPDKPAPPAGYPAIIFCHGYENPSQYETTAGYLSDMEFYAQQGYAVIKPDYRGQGVSLHQGRADSAYYSMAYNTDVMSLISALKKTGYIDKSRLNLAGHSMGSYIALRAAVLSPDIKNLILMAGPLDSLSKMYLSYIPPSDVNNLFALKTRNEVFSRYGTPADETNFWKYASPINLVGRIKAHIQINEGALDQVVPPELSADLDTALSRQHIKHEYYLYPDGDHSLSAQRPLIWARSLKLLQTSQPPA